MASSMLNHIPKVKPQDLPLYDRTNRVVGGYLSKKASSNSTFNKGKWQRRWFQIETDLEDGTIDNYVLIYKDTPEDTKEVPIKHIFQLRGATMSRLTGLSFQINFETSGEDDDRGHIVLGTEAKDQLLKWMETLEKVVSMANLRRDFIDKPRGGDNARDQKLKDLLERGSKGGGGDKKEGEGGGDRDYGEEDEERSLAQSVSPFKRIERMYPTLRLDLDINTIPPATTQRRKFEDIFIADLSRSLNVLDTIIEIHAVKPFPGMPWLTTVAFDLAMTVDMVATDLDENDPDYDDVINDRVFDLRRDILWHLHEMVVDKTSPLYQGFITCKLDSSYSKNLIEAKTDADEIDFVSPDETVQDIFHRYKDIVLEDDDVDISHFTIFLELESKTRPMKVLNPLVLKTRDCAVFQFEIMQALGLEGTMQECFLIPTALLPLGMPKAMSDPIVFEPSSRVGGAVCINPTRLKAGLTYQVIVDDKRGDVLNGLTDQELDAIKNVFDEYDRNRDGSISRNELEDLVRDRTAERKLDIDKRYDEYVRANPSAATRQQADELRKQHYQHLNESQTKLVHMFEMADVDGDGVVSFKEFMLAEAWWMKCAINPNKQHLF